MQFLLHYDKQGCFEEPSESIGFFFANRRVYRSRCLIFTPNNRAGPGPQLLVGYFQYGFLEKARVRKLEAPRNPGLGGNISGARLSLKKLAKATPDEASRDPFFVCLLLSLAQRQARKLASPQQTTYTPHHRYFIYLYEAEITSQLLESLDKPTQATDRTPWPTVKFKRIPFKPFKDFQARLIAELLAPSPLGHDEALEARDGTSIVKE
ncbi:hypothetical protein HRG_000611 [Hirsutella rhossiliensis]|uniref:Uncharacterized protein n=1 Tax=Hirsutella rhossiliensis TaxID=111463 RepID=A0A9P8SN38_9HYPO|nr:uncharacterized protein HRG_00611 [Hirsutella rhossiliensis]KAH0967969.1 hypothetical protein HRG_00611 [Hirsutella rhossiliensis]